MSVEVWKVPSKTDLNREPLTDVNDLFCSVLLKIVNGSAYAAHRKENRLIFEAKRYFLIGDKLGCIKALLEFIDGKSFD